MRVLFYTATALMAMTATGVKLESEQLGGLTSRLTSSLNDASAKISSTSDDVSKEINKVADTANKTATKATEASKEALKKVQEASGITATSIDIEFEKGDKKKKEEEEKKKKEEEKKDEDKKEDEKKGPDAQTVKSPPLIADPTLRKNKPNSIEQTMSRIVE